MKLGKILVCLLVLFLSLSQPLKAAKIEGVVKFSVTNDDKFHLRINVYKGGICFDGLQSIQNGSVIYELSLGEEKVFRIQPDEGQRVKQVWYSRPDLPSHEEIENTIKDNMLVIQTESTDMVLDVTFEPIPGIKPPPTIAGGITEIDKVKDEIIQSIQTGDVSRSDIFVGTMCVAFFFLIILWKRREQDDDSYDK